MYLAYDEYRRNDEDMQLMFPKPNINDTPCNTCVVGPGCSQVCDSRIQKIEETVTLARMHRANEARKKDLKTQQHMYNFLIVVIVFAAILLIIKAG